MNTKTMEGLVGARTNMNLLNTPMRVYKEARNRGDMATMKRSMEYVVKFADKADEYKAEADKGMEEEAEETRKKVQAQREEIIEKRKEESEEQQERMEENGNAQTDTVKISETGKVLFADHAVLDSAGADEIKTSAVKEPVIYTKAGEAVQAETSVNISVSV